MLDIRKLNSLILMKKAREAALNGDCEGCISSYIKAFYLRCTDSGTIDIEFSAFFSYQFRVYLAGRKDFNIPLDEGDEICALIRATYDEMRISLDYSPFDIRPEGEWNLLKSLEIDFRAKKTPVLTA